MESVTLVTEFGSINFDATLEVQTKSSVTLPSYPTESGVRINDHRIILPSECRIKGIVASTPMSFTLDSFITRLSRLTSVRPSTFLDALKQLQATCVGVPNLIPALCKWSELEDGTYSLGDVERFNQTIDEMVKIWKA